MVVILGIVCITAKGVIMNTGMGLVRIGVLIGVLIGAMIGALKDAMIDVMIDVMIDATIDTMIDIDLIAVRILDVFGLIDLFSFDFLDYFNRFHTKRMQKTLYFNTL
jgi:hypothetical protein